MGKRMDIYIEGGRDKATATLPAWLAGIVISLRDDLSDYTINVEKVKPSLYKITCRQTKRYALVIKVGHVLFLNICALAEPDVKVGMHPHHVLIHQEIITIADRVEHKISGLIKKHACKQGSRHRVFKRIKVVALPNRLGATYGGRIKDVIHDDYFYSITTHDHLTYHIPVHLGRGISFTPDHYLVMSSESVFAVHAPGVFNDYYEFS